MKSEGILSFTLAIGSLVSALALTPNIGFGAMKYNEPGSISKVELGQLFIKADKPSSPLIELIRPFKLALRRVLSKKAVEFKLSELTFSGPVSNSTLNRNANLNDFVRGLNSLTSNRERQLLYALVSDGLAPDGRSIDSAAGDDLNDLFDFLTKAKSHLVPGLRTDAVLVRYVLSKLIVSDELHKDGPTAFFGRGAIAPFFAMRFSEQIENIKVIETADAGEAAQYAADLLNIYGELQFLDPEVSWYINKDDMKWIVGIAEKSRLISFGSHIYRSIQRQLMTLDLDHSTGSVAALVTTAKDVIKGLDEEQELLVGSLMWLNEFNSFVDWQAQHSLTIEAAMNLFDQRDRLNADLARAVTINQSKYLSFIRSHNSAHPLIKIAIEGEAARNSFTHDDPIRSSFTNYVYGMIQQVTLMRRGLKDGLNHLNHIDANLGSGISYLKSLSSYERIRTYQSALQFVVFGRHFFSNNSFNDSEAETVENYKKLRSALQVAICVRNLHRLTGQSCEFVAKLRGSNRKNLDSDILQPISSLSNTSSIDPGRMIFDITGNRYVAPGIYYAQSDSKLTAELVTFHPLAMIYTQGHNISIAGEELHGLWLDSSGSDQINERLLPPTDGLAAQADGNRGRKPSTPIPAGSGTNAGNIDLTFIKGEGLLVANGGNGANGFDGANSPNCLLIPGVGLVFKPVEHAWRDKTGRRANDCRACILEVCVPFGGCTRVDLCRTEDNRGHMCGWHDTYRTNTESLGVEAGNGGSSGNGGDSGQIVVHGAATLKNLTSIAFGGQSGGVPGAAGKCGPNGVPGLKGLSGRSFSPRLETK
jgi:hypothetical protein